MPFPRPDLVTAALDAAYTGITDVVRGLDDDGLQAATRCRGWLVADLLLHLVGDAQRALVALASPSPGPPDVDFVSYWRDFAAGDAPAADAHAWWVRRSAAAFDRPAGIVRLWTDTAPAAARAARAADPAGHVATQGHVLAVPDFLATLATEAVIHHLDLTVDLPGAVGPDPVALSVAAATLDGLAGWAARPGRWSAEELLLKGTGRQPLSPADRQLLGPAAEAFPLLG